MARDFMCSETATAVDTAEGRLQGFFLDGLYIFHGVKYADAERFQMPRAVARWEGVRAATNYGYNCPVSGEPMPSGEIYIPHRFWPANEHCQYLNIWTKSLDRGAKMPVMVWLHGGGFSNGSAIEQVAYEGDRLAEFGDVVVVTLNHRLNILGYLDMSSFGAKYANSVNAGMADIVEALRWIRRNIAFFGGDPDNVTVFGQSGGGGKIQALMQIPEAAGLFHKAIIMSGIFGSDGEAPCDHREFILDTMAELGIGPTEPEKLEKVPYYLLMRAFNKIALRKAREEGKLIDWGPVANDWYLGDPMKVGFTPFAKTVPTIAGSVIAEFSEGAKFYDPAGLREAEKLALVKKRYGERAETLIGLFRAAYPDKDLSWLPRLDMDVRLPTTEFIERKAETSSAPAYLYQFALEFNVNGLRPAWHCSDIPFVFHNTYRVPCCGMEGVTERLEEQMAGAWVSFARSGDPSNPALGAWPPYESQNRTTMIFDRVCRTAQNYDRSLMEALRAAKAPMDMKTFVISMMENAEKEQGGDWLY